MRRGRVKFILGIGAIAISLTYLVYGGVRDTMVYYVTVGELKGRVPSVYKDRVRVSGTVVPGSIRRGVDGSLEFKITDGEQAIDVQYRGIVPDVFRDNVEAVVEGLYTPQNVFKAKVLLAKCPTKYDPANPSKRGRDT